MTIRQALAVLAIFATPAAAELRLSAGAGAGVAYHEPCGYDAAPDCMGERVRASGAAPIVGAGMRNLRALSSDWRLRLGAAMSALLIAPGAGVSGSVLTGAGEIGIERGRFSVDVIGGLARVRIANDQMSSSEFTITTGVAVAVRLDSSFSLFGRADLHTMMHAPTGAAFVGAGVEWAPR